MRYRIQEMNASGFPYYEVIDTENNCDAVCATKSYTKALDFIHHLESNSEKHYAEVKWSWEDVHAIRPEWDEAKCRNWWICNQKRLL